MNARTALQLCFAPFFLLLAVGSSSPKKSNGDDESSALASALANANGQTTTTSAPAGAGKVLGHCMQKTGGSCSEKYTFRIGGESAERSGCETINGSYESATACPTNDSLIGTCTQKGFQIDTSQPAPLREKLYYYSAGANKGVTGAKAKEGCTALSGDWTDGPAAAGAPAAAAAASGAKPAAKPAAKAKKK